MARRSRLLRTLDVYAGIPLVRVLGLLRATRPRRRPDMPATVGFLINAAIGDASAIDALTMEHYRRILDIDLNAVVELTLRISLCNLFNQLNEAMQIEIEEGVLERSLERRVPALIFCASGGGRSGRIKPSNPAAFAAAQKRSMP